MYVYSTHTDVHENDDQPERGFGEKGYGAKSYSGEDSLNS